jgi:hypothetical protein
MRVQWRLEEGAAHAAPVEAVIAARLAMRLIPDGLMDFTGCHELDCHDATGVRHHAIVAIGLIHHAESITAVQVAIEINLAAKYFGDLAGHLIGDSRSVGRAVQ